MKIKLMLLLLIMAVGGLFFVNKPDGTPLIAIEDFSVWDILPGNVDLGGLVPGAPEVDVSGDITTIYKWQGADGVWHFSNKLVEGDDVEVLQLDRNTNIIQSFKMPPQNEALEAGTYQTGPSTIRHIPPGLTTISADQITELMGTVNNLQETVDKRDADIKAALEP